MRLSGWKRIGIVVSVAWILGAGIYTYEKLINSDLNYFMVVINDCLDEHHDANECTKQGYKYLDGARASDLMMASIVGIVPVPFAWGFAYLMLFTVRWIRRGF